MWNAQELEGLFNRVLNTAKTQEQDEMDLKKYINEVFNNGTAPSTHELHQFNNLVVKKAEEIARPKATQILGYIADYERVTNVSAYQYTIPKKHKAKLVWAANGTSVDYVRVEGTETRFAQPQRFQAGFYYEPQALVNDDVEYFRKLVGDVADAKIRLYMENISALLAAAVAAGTIPAKNVITGSNLNITQYNKLASTLQRYGGQPIFIADALLVDHFAFQLPTSTTFQPLLTEDVKGELLSDLSISRIARTVAFTLVNPFVEGTGNEVTELPVNEGYMLAGGVKEKPFKVIEFGGLTQYTDFDYNLERVEVKIFQNAAIEFVQGEAIGYVKDSGIIA